MTNFRTVVFTRIIGYLSRASLLFFVLFLGISFAATFAVAQEDALPNESAPPVRLDATRADDFFESKSAPINSALINIDKNNPEPFASAAISERFAQSQNPARPPSVPSTSSDPTELRVVRRNVYSRNTAFFELSNGLRILLKKTTDRQGSIRIYLPTAGVRDEREFAGTGIARLTASLVAEGATTTRSSADTRKTLNSFGTTLRWSTDREGTLFSLDVAADNLETALELATDVVLRSTFDETAFTKATARARRRIEAASRDRESLVADATAETIYFASSYREPLDGRADLLETLSSADVRAFLTSRYSPNRQILAISGPLDPEKTLETIVSLYRSTRRGTENFDALASEPRQVSRRDAFVEFGGRSAELILAWPTVDADDPDAPTLAVVAALLTGGQNSRLSRKVVDGAIPALEVSAQADAPFGVRGALRVRATVAPEKFEVVEPALVAEIRRLSTDAVGSAELLAAQKRLETSFAIKNRAPSADLETRVRDLAATGDPDFSLKFLDSVRRVDGESIRRVASERLGNVYSRIAVVPQGFAPRLTALGNVGVPTPPVFQSRTEPNGARVQTLNSNESRLVDVRIVALAGALVETRETAGRSELLGELLDKGSAKFSRDDVAQYFDSIGATFEVEVGRNTILLGATVLKEDFVKTFQILLDAATNPLLDSGEFRRAKERRQAKAARLAEDEYAPLFELFAKTIPQTSAYSVPLAGTPESIEITTLDDLRAFHRQIFAPQNLIVGVAGDVGDAETQNAIDVLLGAIPKNPVFRPISFERPNAPMQALQRFELTRVDVEGRALLAVAIPAAAERDDLAALTVLQTVWKNAGGGKLAEKFADFDETFVPEVGLSIGPVPGYMTIWWKNAPGVLPQTAARVRAVVEASVKSPISEKECADAKKQILARLDGRYLSLKEQLTRSILDDFYRVSPEGDPVQRDALFREAIRQTSPDDVARVAKKYWGRDADVFIVVSPEPFPGMSVKK